MSDLCGCSRPTASGYLCPLCDSEMEQLTAELPAMVGLLYDAMGGQVRFTSSAGGGRAQRSTKDEHGDTSIETGLDLPSNATAASTLLRSYLRRTTRLLMDAGAAHPIRLPADELNPMARFLYAHLDTLRRLPDVYELKEELRRLTARIVRVVDRPLDRVFAGICSVQSEAGECTEDLYVEKDAVVILCRCCGFQHDVKNRRQELRLAVSGQLLTIRQICAALPNMLGVPVNAATLRKWKERKKIMPESQNDKGEDRYLVGAVLDVIATQAEKAYERQMKKAG